MTYALSLLAFSMLLVAMHATESEPQMTRRKRRALMKERLDLNPAMKGRR